MKLCRTKPFLWVYLFFVFFFQGLFGIADWTVLIYTQASNNLDSFAHKNFADMSLVGSNSNLNILTQWYQAGKEGGWRYKVEKGKMILDSCVLDGGDGNGVKDLVNAMDWAVKKCPAKKYCLILWNHGLGIIDPLWGVHKSSPTDFGSKLLIESGVVQDNPRIQIQGLTIDANSEQRKIAYAELATDYLVKRMDDANLSEDLSMLVHRGILFNEYTKTYMTNQILTQALSDIKTKVLGNNKIDVLGMDACLMAMVEVGYQSRNYANIMVASQEVELAHGWNYLKIMQELSTNVLSPVQVAQNIVLAYELQYKDKVQFYTQSAIKLDKMDAVKISLDKVVSSIKACQKINLTATKELVRQARRSSLQFSMQSFVDLHTFLNEIKKQAEVNANSPLAKTQQMRDLKNSINEATKQIQESVVANTTGNYLTRAKGLSIYFPQVYIDECYPLTDFAKNSSWMDVLKLALA